MKKLKSKSNLKRVLIISALAINCLIMTSCSPYIWMAVLAGLMGVDTTQTYNNSYPSSTGSTYYSGSSSGSTSSYSSSRKCSRCSGTGSCNTCKGAGRVNQFGTMSIVSKEKYEQRCGVCNGSGKCGVCDGKGTV